MTNSLNEDKAGNRLTVRDGEMLVVDSGGTILVADGAYIVMQAKNGLSSTTGDPPDTMKYNVTFTPGAAGANVCEVTCQVCDYLGHAKEGTFNFDLWLSDGEFGDGLTATTASGAVAAKAGGAYTVLATYVSKKAFRVQTNSSGVFILSITDSVKSAFFIAAQRGLDRPNTSAALVTGNYG